MIFVKNKQNESYDSNTDIKEFYMIYVINKQNEFYYSFKMHFQREKSCRYYI